MSKSVLIEDIKKLNKGSYYLIDDKYLSLDENASLDSIKLPEGYSFGSNVDGNAYIYDDNDEVILNVEFVPLERYINTIDNEEQLEKYGEIEPTDVSTDDFSDIEEEELESKTIEEILYRNEAIDDEEELQSKTIEEILYRDETMDDEEALDSIEIEDIDNESSNSKKTNKSTQYLKNSFSKNKEEKVEESLDSEEIEKIEVDKDLDSEEIEKIEVDKDLDSEEIEELEEIEVEDVTDRNSQKVKELNKVVKFFNNYFKKKEKEKKELEEKNSENIEIEVEDVTDRKSDKIKKSNKIVEYFKKLFSKKDKKESVEDVEIFEEEIKDDYASLKIDQKIDKFFEETDITQDQLHDIYNKVGFILNNRKGSRFEDVNIHKFLNENRNVESNTKFDLFTEFLDDKCINILNFKRPVIKEIFNNHNLDKNREITSLFNEILLSNDLNKVEELYIYVTNNEILDDNDDNLIDKMYSILNKERKEEICESNKKEENEVVMASKEEPINNCTNNEEIFENKDETNNNVAKLDAVNTKTEKSLENAYNKYKEILSSYEDKSSELQLLREEYNILKDSIFGKDLEFISRRNPSEKQIYNINKRIQKVRVLISEEGYNELSQMDRRIKELETEIQTLLLKIQVYEEKDIENLYRKQFEDEYKREERMRQSVDVFNEFNDEELAAIYKYKAYEQELSRRI